MYPGYDPNAQTPTYDPTGWGGIDWTQVFTGAEHTISTILSPGAQNPWGIPPGSRVPLTGQSPTGGGIGVGISTNTLLLIVGGIVLFMLGSKRR